MAKQIKPRLSERTTDSRLVRPNKLRPFQPIDKGDRLVDIPPTPQDLDPPSRIPDSDGLLRKQRADFRTELFYQAIKQKGRFVIWRKAVLCPCFNPASGQTEMNCIDCDGSGFVYLDPMKIQSWMTQFDQRTDLYKHAGTWLSGEGSATVLPVHRCGFRDSLECIDDLMPFNEILVRGDRRGMRSKLPAGVDSARYRIQQAVRMAYKDKADRTQLAEEFVDFVIQPGTGWISWMPGSERIIPPQARYSLLYNFHPVWIATSNGAASRVENSIKGQPKPTMVGLPVRVLIKLDFLLDVNAPVTGPLGTPQPILTAKGAPALPSKAATS